MIDAPPYVAEWIWLLILPVAVLVGSYLLGHALPMRFAIAFFGIGTTVLVFLTYRLYQSQVDACKDSYEVSVGGDKFSCLEPGNWFANMIAVSFLLLVELGLTALLAGCFVRWLKQRRPTRPTFSAKPS